MLQALCKGIPRTDGRVPGRSVTTTPFAQVLAKTFPKLATNMRGVSRTALHDAIKLQPDASLKMFTMPPACDHTMH